MKKKVSIHQPAEVKNALENIKRGVLEKKPFKLNATDSIDLNHLSEQDVDDAINEMVGSLINGFQIQKIK